MGRAQSRKRSFLSVYLQELFRLLAKLKNMKCLNRLPSGIVAGVAGVSVALILSGCESSSLPAPEVSETTTTSTIPELQEKAATRGVEANAPQLCKAIEPSLSPWRTNSVKAARGSFNAAVFEWALHNDISVRSIMKNPHDIDIALAKSCPEIWKETKLALATRTLAETLVMLPTY